MFYVAHGSIPHARHTQHRAPDGSLYAEELFGVEGFTGRSSLLYHVDAADADPPDRAGPADRDRGRRRRAPSPPADEDRRACRRGRRDHGAGSRCTSTTTSSSASSGRPSRCPPDTFYRNGDRRRDAVRPRGHRRLRHDLRRRSATAPATTSCCRSGRPGGSTPTRARSSGCSTSRRRRRSSRPKRYRNDYGQLLEHSPYSQRDIRCPGRRRAPRDEHGDFVIHVRSRDRITAYHYRHHPFDVVGWDGYLWPFRVQHRRLPADHRPRPPAAAGPPDVPGAQLRGLLVRAPQVRLPPARDPGAVQPLEHQQRRGHLLRRRQLHEPARRGDRLVHAPPGGDPARPAPGHGRGVDRQGGDRGAGGHGRHVPPAQAHAGRAGARRRPLPVHLAARPDDHAKEASELAERGPEAFPD